MFTASSRFFPSLFGAGPFLRRSLRLLAVGVCFAGASMLAHAQANNLTDTWRINGNGWPGDLVISQATTSGRIQGSMYGNRIVGYFSTGERTAVLVRYSSDNIPTQAFVGKVNAGGTQWSGRFYALDVGPSGGSQFQNAWNFVATRGTSSTPAAPPALIPAWQGPEYLAPSFTFYNRPAEFGTGWPGPLNITLGSIATPTYGGQIDGTLFGDVIMGTYARGTIAFIRLNNQQPTQVYVGYDQFSELVSSRLAGSFYPLTEGMGASPVRMTYEWRAE